MLYCQYYDSQEQDMENAIIIKNMYMNLYCKLVATALPILSLSWLTIVTISIILCYS